MMGSGGCHMCQCIPTCDLSIHLAMSGKKFDRCDA
jgi:hypothetical protein